MWIRRLSTFALCLLPTGCQLAGNAVHNIRYEMTLATADHQERANYEKLAKESWAMPKAKGICSPSTKDYEDGFKAGFIDYLQFGGSGQPPYMPPQRYWRAGYRTPEGHRAIEEWFAGFRHGVEEAKASGYRPWVT